MDDQRVRRRMHELYAGTKTPEEIDALHKSLTPEVLEALVNLENLQERLLAIEARYQSMSPEERADFHKGLEENQPEIDFLNDIIVQIKNGSITPEEANRWANEVGQMQDEREKRLREGTGDV